MTDISQLSEREIEILRLLATGASNKEIAQKLVISINTVKVHLRNIYAKLEVASRTEATLVAVRSGLVLPNLDVPVQESEQQDDPLVKDGVQSSDQETPKRLRIWGIVPFAAIAVFMVILAAYWAFRSQTSDIEPTSVPLAELIDSEAERWQPRADFPTSRAGFASVSFGNQIYAIGGETPSGITGIVERYDTEDDIWETLSPKEIAVTDVDAAVIGGLIYVPGGKLGDGSVTAIHEVYDPRQDRWDKRASLPVPLSAYSLVAFEGRLYLFGGWDGDQFVADVYIYDPAQDNWQMGTPMPTARGFAGAVVASGRIFVVGGFDGETALSVNEEYSPSSDDGQVNPWQERAPLPDLRYNFGLVSIAEIIHLVGGEGGNQTSAFKYFPSQGGWQSFNFPLNEQWSDMGLEAVGSFLYVFGGRYLGVYTAQHQSYQAVFTVLLPVQN